VLALDLMPPSLAQLSRDKLQRWLHDCQRTSRDLTDRWSELTQRLQHRTLLAPGSPTALSFPRHARPRVRIPTIADSDSDRSRTLIPIQGGQGFR